MLLREAGGDLGMSAGTAAHLKTDVTSEDHFRVNALRKPLWEAVPLKVRSPRPLVPEGFLGPPLDPGGS